MSKQKREKRKKTCSVVASWTFSPDRSLPHLCDALPPSLSTLQSLHCNTLKTLSLFSTPLSLRIIRSSCFQVSLFTPPFAGRPDFSRWVDAKMSAYNSSFVNNELSKPTSIFGLRLWVVIGIFLGSLIVVALFLLSLCLTSRRRDGGKGAAAKHRAGLDAPAATPPISKEILEIVPSEAPHAAPAPEIQIDMGKVEHRVVYSDRYSSGESRGTERTETASLGSGNVGPEVSHLGWGRWYTLRELEEATGGLCEENVIGEGGYGIVYRGVLGDGTRVAVKNLLNNR